MTDQFLALVGSYGTWAVFISAFLSCLLVPIPTSLMMLTAGALAAAGDISIPPLLAATFAGAVLGDQAGYMVGRFGGAPVIERLERAPSRRAVVARARILVDERGGIGVFFSTWALAPLGPYVNIVAGATGLKWRRFTLWDILGEAIWVNLYIWLGYAFSGSVATVAEILGDVVGLVVAVVVALLAALWIRSVMAAQRAARRGGVKRATT